MFPFDKKYLFSFAPLLTIDVIILVYNFDQLNLNVMIQKEYFKLEISEGNHRDLKATRLALEKEITVKKNSIAIDRDRCLRYIFLSKNK